MDKLTFTRFQRIVYEKSGIWLREGKEALVAARVGKRMRALGIDDHRKYLRYLMADSSGDETIHFLDVISTNVTGFFRERDHFDFLASTLRTWAAAGQRRFRFWSAACATGEEPYSMAMTILELPELGGADVKILATDLSTRALQKCQEATYNKERMQTVHPALRQRYFFRHRDAKKEVIYTATDQLATPIVFKRLNLSHTPYPMRGPFDFVFCRNVMIYFDREMCLRLLNEIHRLLRPGGFLMAGHAESMTCSLGNFRFVKPSIYMKEAA